MDYRPYELQELKDWLIKFANVECKNVSPLYYDLSLKTAKDDQLVSIAAHCKYGQPLPNLFFASVQSLLYKEPNQELAQYYPSITQNHKSGLPFALFKEFCLDHQQEIIELEQNNIVQTNALNRTAYLLPIFSHLFDNEEINIIDIGTSAGLTLNMDKYEYHYNDQYHFGNSLVKIKSEIKSGSIPLFNRMVKIKNRIGIDQNPLDVNNIENAHWLKSLIWADQVERLEKIENAINLAREENINFIKASQLFEFEEIILEQEKNIPLIVYHTHALYQFSKEERNNFWKLMDKIGKERDFTYLATEGSRVFKKDYSIKGILVEVTQYKKGKKNTQLMAHTNGHANWIKWLI